MGRRSRFAVSLVAASVSPAAALVGAFGVAVVQGADIPARPAAAISITAAIKPVLQAKQEAIRFDGIVLESTASSEVTQRAVDHLRGRLRQYRRFLPPRVELGAKDRAEITIRLHGTTAAYRAAVATYGLRVDNPACYLSEPNVILLGFDGAKYDDVLAAGEENAARLKRQRDEDARRFADTRKEEDERYRRDNVSAQFRHDLSLRRLKEFQRTKAEAERRRREAEDKNEKLFGDATDRLLALADHELFHAYVRTEVYPQVGGGLPAWLDEGLAQLVEHAEHRADGPIFDVRSSELAKRLRLELKQAEPPTVASLIASDDKHYLATDRRETDAVRRRYLFVWALAQLIVDTKRLVPRDGLDRYVADDRRDATAAFARFTKKSPAEFEVEWREYLAKISR